MEKADADQIMSILDYTETAAAGERNPDAKELLQSASVIRLQSVLKKDAPAISRAADRYRKFTGLEPSETATARKQTTHDRMTYPDLYATKPGSGEKDPLRHREHQSTFMHEASRKSRGSIVTWLYYKDVHGVVNEFSSGAISQEEARGRIRTEYGKTLLLMRKLAIVQRWSNDTPEEAFSAQPAATGTRDKGGDLGL